MISHKTEIRVRFSETDKMQFLHNVKYIEYFEVARTEMLRHYGLPYKEIENNGYEMPVTQTFVKYKSPAYYDELLIIEASVNVLYSAKVHIDYAVYRKENNQLIAEGFNELAFIKTSTKKLVRPPQFFIDSLSKYFEKQHA
jgi:acyl-CoA thioester hydrolase